MVLEKLFRAEITLAAPHELGDTPLGRRRIINITGGRFTGERLSGRVLPGGADWQVIRSNGVTDFDARYTIETDDRVAIYVRHGGYRHGPPEVMKKLLEGQEIDASLYYMRGSMLFETGEERYAWLNRIVCVTTGARRAKAVELEVFEVK
ncbi:MAG: DUF3237 domain-containing protein [Burkholderiales bacterium]